MTVVDLSQALHILFAFALGSCVGSFLNVVIWRLPQVQPVEGEGLFHSFLRSWRALSWPPSYCPNCKTPLKWYDNLPVIGWIKLRGRCRFCNEPISIRYPIIEGVTGLLFALYYVAFFMGDFGPCRYRIDSDGLTHFISTQLVLREHWPIYLLDMVLVSALLAASLIDAESFIIPLEIPWFVVPWALAEHAIFDRSGWPGALNPSAPAAALAAGAAVGLFISFILWYFGILPASFAQGEPLLEVDKAKLAAKGETPPQRDYTPAEIRAEMRKEMLFLMPPLALGSAWVLLTWKLPAVGQFWTSVLEHGWVSGLLGSVLGMLVGGFVVWLTRILGSTAFGREAMGMGDVHLMAAVGAVLGPGQATVAFFLAPFIALLIWVWLLLGRRRPEPQQDENKQPVSNDDAAAAGRPHRELPFGPNLSLATGFAMLFYCPIADFLSPGLTGLFYMISRLWGGG